MTVLLTAQQTDLHQQGKENFVTRKDKYWSIAKSCEDL
jgi:hypothetical protein